MFQNKVNRQLTLGFVGELVRDGTVRAKPGRITSLSVAADGSTNRIGRVFGYAAVNGAPSNAALVAQYGRVAEVAEVVVGGANFFGILGHPKHYALQGNSSGTLQPSLDLPVGTEGEFFDSFAGLIVEIFNNTTAALNVTYGDKLAYVPVGITAGNNPLGLPLGAIVAYPKAGTLPTGFVAIPNSFIHTELSLSASAVGALIASPVIAQLAN